MTSILSGVSARRVRFLCFLPPVAAALAIALLGVDVLRWDEWIVWINLLDRLDNGTLSLSTLIAQQNEQRLLFARVLGLLHMELFDLNRFPEFFTNLALAGLAFWGLVRLYNRTERRLASSPSPLVILALSALCFSLLQWDGFTQGINNVLFAMAALLTWGILLIADDRPAPWRIGAAMAVGVLGSFNFANGLFYWFVLLPLVWTTKHTRRFKLAATLLWLAVAAVVWSAYFNDYVKPPHHPALTESLFKPHMMLGYFLTYLGGPLCSDKATLWPLATMLGLCGLVVWTMSLFSLFRSDRRTLVALAPWMALAAFGCLSGMSTSLGRAALGLTQALESRYVTFGGFFWIGLIPVALAAWRGGYSGLPRRFSFLARPLPWFVLFCTAMFCLSSVLCLVILHKRHNYLSYAREELYTLERDELLGKIFPDTAFLKTHLKPFYDKRLTVFRSIPRLDDLAGDPATSTPPGRITAMEPVSPPFGEDRPGAVSGISIQGRFAPHIETPDWVIITADNQEVFASNVVFMTKDPDASFAVFLPAAWFTGRTADIRAWAVYGNDNSAILLDGGGEMSIPAPWAPEPIVDRYFLSR